MQILIIDASYLCLLYNIRCHSLPNLSDLWPANASKIDIKEVMESNLYPFI